MSGLLFFSGLAFAQVNPFRVPGNVVLMGVAQSQHEADLALQKIRGVKGVRNLKSHLRIVAAKNSETRVTTA